MAYLLITYADGSRGIQEDTGVHVTAVTEEGGKRVFKIFEAGEHDRHTRCIKVDVRAELQGALKWLVNEEL